MKAIAVLTVLALSVVGCSDDSPGSSSTSTSLSTSSTAELPTATAPPVGSTTVLTGTAPPVSTTAPPTTTTTVSPPTTTATTTTTASPPTTMDVSLLEFSVSSRGFFPDPARGSGEAHGSGCVVGSAALPDGMWFGFVDDASADTVTFDLACLWTGEAAVAAATADGEEEFFDFYIGNNNLQTRSVSLSAVGIAYWLDGAGDLTPQAVPMPDWPVASGTAYQVCPSRYCAAWLYVNDGVVTELIEQYLP